MAKAVKIVGAVALGAGLLALTGGLAAGGLSAGLGALLGGEAIVGVGLGVSIGALIAGGAALISIGSSIGMHAPTVPASQVDRLNATINPRAFRTTSLGSTALATDIRYQEWFGPDQEYCGLIIAVASHKVQSAADEIWLDDEMAWSAAGGVVVKYVGYFLVQNVRNEGSPSNTVEVSTPDAGKWNTAHRLTGCAYVHIQFRVTGVDKKAESPFSSGIPSRMTIIGRGGMLYDVRRDSSAGGSGPMRATDQSTWRYVADDGAEIGENLALHVLRELLGWRIQNPVTGEWKLAVGSGLPPKRIDLPSFIVGANLCDEAVTIAAGGTEPRYHGAGVLNEGMTPKARLDALLACCCGRLLDRNGKLSLDIRHNDLAAAATDGGLNDDDVVGPFTWNPDPGLEATPNIARGQYVDASPASLYQLIDYPEVGIASPDGIDRVLPLDLGFVESPSQAQRIAKQSLERRQYDRSFSAPFDITAWRYGVGDLVPFTFSPLGFERRLFRVAECDPQQNPVPVVLTEENAAIYAWDASDAAPVTAAEPIVYDRRNSPIVQAIAAAGDEIIATQAIVDSQAATIAAQETAIAAQGAMLTDQAATLVELNDRVQTIEES